MNGINQPLTLRDFEKRHIGKPLLVIGTGPSVWSAPPHLKQLIEKYKPPTIAINRAFDIWSDLPPTYQISTDKIWKALIGPTSYKGQAKQVYTLLQGYFKNWKRNNPHEAENWSFEDFVGAYRDVLLPKRHDHLFAQQEVWRYFRLCSPHAPFIRFSWDGNSQSCPYQSIRFRQQKNQKDIQYGQSKDGALMVKGNTAQSAIHLAAVMMAQPIFMIGVDLTKRDDKNRPWENRAHYLSDKRTCSISQGFRRLSSCLRQKVHIVNLNPNTRCNFFEVVPTQEAGLEYFERELKRASHIIDRV